MKQHNGNGGQAMRRADTWRGLRFAGAMLAFSAAAACAQAPVVVPIPFVTTIVGVAPGGTSTACTNDIPTFAIAPGPIHYGDGCVGTQATLSAPYSVSTDLLGNVYISDYNHFALRVLYNGGAALSAAIVAANPNVANLVPKPGNVYTLAGGSRQGTITKTGSPLAYYCNSAGTGPSTLVSNGNNCPGTEAEVKPRSAAIDADGNVFFPNISGGTEFKVFYVGGTAAAKLIMLENPTLSSVLPGYVYQIAGSGTQGWGGDGGLATNAAVNQLRAIAVDSNENLYLSDGNTNGATANNNIRKVNGTTGIITTLAGSGNCTYPVSGTTGCPEGTVNAPDGDNGPATSASFTTAYGVWVDANNNVYVADVYNGRIRVIYQGTGSILGVTNPQTGYIYTVAGGGATSAAMPAASGTLATQLAFGQVQSGGIDPAGNLYLYDTTNRYLWRIDGKTGIATILGGLGATGVAAPSGSFCSGTAGPKSMDTGGDGCPATEAAISLSGEIVFDAQGNIYQADSTNSVVRKLSFNTQFPATAAGSTSTQPVAFATLSAGNFTAENFSLQGGAGSEFSDAGGDTCALNAVIGADTTCVFNVQFAPAQAGLRTGSMALTGSAISSYLGGVGLAANVSVDPGTQTTIGASLTANGVGVDLLGNLYVSDSSSGTVKKVAAVGGTPATLIAGLNAPAQIAVDGKGNVYVADAGNNRVAMTSGAGGTVTAIGAGLSAPTGVAVDAVGNVYISDTGNNRVVRVFATGGQQTLPITGLTAPAGLALDSAGDLFVADYGNSRVVELGANASQTTINLGTTAFAPDGISVDAAGDLYVIDATHSQVLSYAAGSTNGNPELTGLTAPVGIAVDTNGSVYVAQSSANGGVVALNRAGGNITYPVTNVGQANASPITFTDTGNQPLIFTGTAYASNVTAP
jgi:sugar lactone lactonase YvrE